MALLPALTACGAGSDAAGAAGLDRPGARRVFDVNIDLGDGDARDSRPGEDAGPDEDGAGPGLAAGFDPADGGERDGDGRDASDAEGSDAAETAGAEADGDDSGPEPDSDADSDGEALEAKADPDFLVPPTLSRKSHLAVAESAAAWVEEGPAGTSRVVLWAFGQGLTPQVLPIPNLDSPTELRLSEDWLVYVDTRYGDADLFAFHLGAQAEQMVAVVQGAQHQPSLDGTTLAWRDCRDCVPGDPAAAAEIYTIELTADLDSAPEEQRVTTDDVDDYSPSLGRVAGFPALAWVAGEGTIRVQSPGAGLDGSWAVEGSVLGLVLAQGNLAYRRSPLVINPDSMMVINPDSMMPSDVLVADAQTGAGGLLTSHSETELHLLEQGPQLVAAPDGALAFLESVPGQLPLQRLRILEPQSGAQQVAVVIESAHEPALSTSWLGFLAPRADNGGVDDVHLLPR